MPTLVPMQLLQRAAAQFFRSRCVATCKARTGWRFAALHSSLRINGQRMQPNFTPFIWGTEVRNCSFTARCVSDGPAVVPSGDVGVKLDILVEDNPLPSQPQSIPDLVANLEVDGKAVVQEAVTKLWLDQEAQTRTQNTPDLVANLEVDGKAVVQEAVKRPWLFQGAREKPKPVEVSIVLSNDEYIAELNQFYRFVEGPTDVLSFQLQDDDDLPTEGYPYTVLGDIIISLETAERQAKERGHSLLDETRILLVHGVLHLLGYDHEQGPTEQQEMQAEERRILQALNWTSDGLIAAAQTGTSGTALGSQSSNGSAPGTPPKPSEAYGRPRRGRQSDIRLLALDMDGTLLDSSSQVLPSSVDAIRAALSRGVMVCLATGKARVAAIKAMHKVGLAGDGLVVSEQGPGIFLQGLAVYGDKGQTIPGANLSPSLVEKAFRYSEAYGIPLCAFLGDRCVTLKLTAELEELHSVYYEPLAEEVGSVEQIVGGPPVKKLLFMTQPEAVEQQLKPDWQEACRAEGGMVMQAVPNMLEIVPLGINKWVGAQALLPVLGVSRESFMAIGDGGNDLELVSEAGLGIAMGNAVNEVKRAADFVVASNVEGGIAEAIERFIL